MDEYIIPLGGFEYAVQANSEQEARQKAMLDHVRSVGRQSADTAALAADQRGQSAIRDQGLDNPLSPEFQSLRERGQTEGTAAAAGPALSILGTSLLPANRMVMGGLGAYEGYKRDGIPGAAIGAGAGVFAPEIIRKVGAPLLERLVGGSGLGGRLLRGVLGAGRGAAEGATMAATGAAKAEAQAAKIAAAEARAAEAHAARMETARLRNDLLKQRLESKAPARVAKSSPPAAPPTEGATALQPEPDFIDPSAVKVLPFPPAKGTVKPATNLGGSAKPGPAPTPPEKLEEALQATLDNLKAQKAGAVRGKSPVVDEALSNAEKARPRYAPAPKWGDNIEADLKASGGKVTGELVAKYNAPLNVRTANGLREHVQRQRISNGITREMETSKAESLTNAEGMHQREATAGMTERVAARRKAVGSQKVARELGMERHQVQSDAGVITDEALGEVSKLIPEEPWANIVTKMKAMPPSERFDYVARARGAKNMAQIEQLRRSLEIMGLLVPVGLAAGAVSSDQ